MSFVRRSVERERNTDEISFYWQHYDLTADPFSVISSSDMYYPIPRWEQHIDLMQHVIKNQNVMFSVIAPEGAGKTTLAEQFMLQMDAALLIHHFVADSLFSTRKLVRELEIGFKLKPKPNEAPEDQLDAQVAEVQYSKKTCLLIIDEAHFLPLETLNSLLFLLKQQSVNQMRLHILLFGDVNLQAKLANLSRHEGCDDLMQILELAPLTLEETTDYIEYRLNKAGLIGMMPLTMEQIEQIFVESAGLPNLINLKAQQIMLEKFDQKTSQKTFIKQHQVKIVSGVLLVAVLIASAYILNRNGQYTATVVQPKITFSNSNDKSVAQNTHVNQVPQQIAHDVAAPNTTTISDIVAIVPAAEVPTAPTYSNTSSLAVNTTTDQIAIANDAGSQQPMVPPQSMAPQSIDEPLPIAKSKVSASHHHTMAAKKKHPLDVASGNYTLQIIGLGSRSTLEQFMQTHKIGSKAQIHKISLHHKPFYILTYGRYPTRHASVVAKSKLPMALQKYNPYPRTLSSLK